MEDPPEGTPPREVPAGHAGFTFIGHPTFLVRPPALSLDALGARDFRISRFGETIVLPLQKP